MGLWSDRHCGIYLLCERWVCVYVGGWELTHLTRFPHQSPQLPAAHQRSEQRQLHTVLLVRTLALLWPGLSLDRGRGTHSEQALKMLDKHFAP